VELPSNEVITEATLSFDNITNWDDKGNILYIHLLDNPKLGQEFIPTTRVAAITSPVRACSSAPTRTQNGSTPPQMT
jgi:hypothetical protein